MLRRNMAKRRSGGFLPSRLSAKLYTSSPSPPQSSSLWKEWEQLRAAGSGPEKEERKLRDVQQRLRQSIQAALPATSLNSEATIRTSSDPKAISVTREFRQVYERIASKDAFLNMLAQDFDTVETEIIDSIRGVESIFQQQNRPPMAKLRAQEKLRSTLEPLYLRIWKQIATEPDGIRFLVNMRADMLNVIRSQTSSYELRSMNEELRKQLQLWFDVGNLEFRQIQWQQPASLLIVKGEAVHTINSWEELKQRLGPKRRCYGYLHPHMPGEVLIFIQVAITEQISSSIETILQEKPRQEDDTRGTCAIFYSISSTQRGLDGIGLGHSLIQDVTSHLRRTIPHLHTFSTLSPVPGFSRYLEQALQANDAPILESVLPNNAQAFTETLRRFQENPAAAPEFTADASFRRALEGILQRYLTTKKRGAAIDPVAHFHLSNGASIYRLNWLGDVSVKGRKQSYGWMVNYRYELDKVEANRQRYRDNHPIALPPPVAMSSKL